MIYLLYTMSSAEFVTLQQPENLDQFRGELTHVLAAFETPKTLAEARNAVLQLPGMNRYLELTKGAEDEALAEMTKDTLHRAQALSEIGWVGYLSGMSDAERTATFTRPDKKPYETLLDEPVDRVGLLRQYLTIGSYLTKEFEQARDQHESEGGSVDSQAVLDKAKRQLRTFEEHSVHPVFGPLVDDLADRIWGINPNDRKKGTINGPDTRVTGIIETVAQEVAQREGLDASEISTSIYRLTNGGDIQLALRPFLQDYVAQPHIRRALIEIFKRAVGDRELTAEKVENIWLVELYKRKMGLNLGLGYDLNGFPPADELEGRIMHFLNRQTDVVEVYTHIRREAPEVFAQAIAHLPKTQQARLLGDDTISFEDLDEIGEIDYDALIAERNERVNAPNKLPTPDEIDTRQREMGEEWESLMPIAQLKSATTTVHAPARMGASRRAFNCHYLSGNRESSHGVTDSILNPYEGEERYFRVQAHEQTHEAHNTILKLAEDAGFIRQGAAGAVSHGVREMLALMVDHFAQLYYKKTRSSATTTSEPVGGGKYTDVKLALVYRVQGPYGLSQLWTRQHIHKYIDEGQITPTRETARAIADEVGPRVQNAHAAGVNIRHYRSALATNIWELGPYDGANYILEDLQDEIDTAAENDTPASASIPPVRQAFEDRFGQDWLSNSNASDARAILLLLYAETGNHPQGAPEDMQYFAQMVKDTDPKEARRQLVQMGMDERYI